MSRLKMFLKVVVVLGVVAGSTVWFAVPTQAAGWTIEYPPPGQQVSGSGGLSCGGTAPSGTPGYYCEVVVGGTTTSGTGNAGFMLWSNVIGTGFTTGAATLTVYADNTKKVVYATVNFTFN